MNLFRTAARLGLLLTLACQTGALSGLPDSAPPQIPLWPAGVPDPMPVPGPETETKSDGLLAGLPVTEVTNVTRPTMTIYPPTGKNTGAAVVVFPGGGFELLAIDFEGTEVCDWLTAQGVTCVLLKYRVPSLTYDWRCHCRPDNLAIPTQGLEDAQRAMGLLRRRAGEWHIDPHKIGVLGFSAGGYLAASISTNFQHRLYEPVDDADTESARPDFAIALYPGHLHTRDGGLNPNVPVSRETPPTFLLQAEDDTVDGIEQSLVYYAALEKAGVPVEMHLYAQGGHAFGLRPSQFPITGWPRLAETWLRTIGVI
jgi:acetyl esterase/lipase